MHLNGLNSNVTKNIFQLHRSLQPPSKLIFFPFFFQALEKTIASMQSVLNRTLSSAMAATKKDEKPSPRQLELKLIQSRDEILHPQVTIKATKMMPKA